MKANSSKCADATKAELAWIEKFRKVCSECPKSLWLFSASGALHVMKTPKNGEEMNEYGGVNQENSLTIIQGIRNDGGDW